MTSLVGLLHSFKIENPVTSGLRQIAACICMNKEFERPAAVFSLSPFSLSLLFGSCWKQSRRPVSHL